MERHLLLLRHGKSDWNTGVEDFKRPLKDRGKRSAQRIAVWLQQNNLVPDHIISSPAERAIVTAEKTAKAMGMASRDIEKDDRIYAASLADLLQVLADLSDRKGTILLVGHNPGLEMLVDYLADTRPELVDGKLVPTAALAHFMMPDSLEQLEAGSGKLIEIIRPKGLPKKFPFPDPDSKELRDRPSYYYYQSSVIPYRVNEGKLEILVISSSKNKHYVVPKGIHEPGLSARKSAAKEAWEEAGVEGEVSEKKIGHYEYDKWGGTCLVDVFAMEVNYLVPENEWEESHRGRQWLPPDEAIEHIKQQALKPMIAALAERFSS